MLKLFKKRKELAVEFCDACAHVCDASCRSSALRERARLGVSRFRPPF